MIFRSEPAAPTARGVDEVEADLASAGLSDLNLQRRIIPNMNDGMHGH
jgi:hypothetical protein